MILQSIADGWRIRFFPILWREDDQVSNVKLFRQASRVLGIALAYAFRRKQFLQSDHSSQPGRTYGTSVLFENATSPGTTA
jgi:hypothetical protein